MREGHAVKRLVAFFRVLYRALLAGTVVFSAVAAHTEETPEYQVKAVMLYNFALFVEWPPATLSGDSAPFVVCVLGRDPFGPWLKYEFGDTSVGNHPVEIRYPENVEHARRCHMVFISRSEHHRMKQVLSGLRGFTVLTVSDVGDIGDFCRLGGMVGFITERNTVRFDLNAKAIGDAGLGIDARLKRIAQSVNCGQE